MPKKPVNDTFNNWIRGRIREWVRVNDEEKYAWQDLQDNVAIYVFYLPRLIEEEHLLYWRPY